MKPKQEKREHSCMSKARYPSNRSPALLSGKLNERAKSVSWLVDLFNNYFLSRSLIKLFINVHF